MYKISEDEKIIQCIGEEERWTMSHTHTHTQTHTCKQTKLRLLSGNDQLVH